MIKLILIATIALTSIPSSLAKQKPAEDADKPAHRLSSKWWKQRHEQKLAKAKNTQVDLLFIGDSITHGWENKGRKLWGEYYASRKAFNLGYSGDRTQHVLWRLDNGEMEGMKPKVAVIMIGTNNTGHNMQKARETAKGIKGIITRIQKISPETKVLLLAIFPRGEQADHPMRVRNTEVNNIIKTYADDKNITYLDINSKFLNEEGVLTKEVMPDRLHPQAPGYKIWAEAMEPTLKKLLGEK